MASFIFSFIAVTFFCVCCHQFIKVVVTPIPNVNQTGFSKTALRVKKQYQVFSWGVMTTVFLVGLVVSFIQVYTQV